MQFQGAVIREQRVTFAVVIVKKHIIDNRSVAEDMITDLRLIFPGMPIVLMAQDSYGRPTYFGRRDISQFLSRVPLSAIPWREYTLH